MNNEIKVSICVLAYNHEKYIGKAMDSILMQEVNFGYEIIVGEDYSTDNTRQILLDYAANYPEKINLILHEENIGMMANDLSTLKACRGAYIASVEGDDYWNSDRKLQIQVDKMEEHPELDLSFHSAYCLYKGKLSKKPSWDYGKERILYPESILEVLGQFAPTSSYLFRREVIDKLPAWVYETAPMGDFYFEMYGAQRGGVLFIDSPMSVYRTNTMGSWSTGMDYRSADYLEFNKKLLESLQLLEKDFSDITESFQKKRSDPLFSIAIYYLFANDYRKFSRYLNESVNQYRYFSKKQWFVYKFRYFPWIVRSIYRCKSLLPRAIRLRFNRDLFSLPDA